MNLARNYANPAGSTELKRIKSPQLYRLSYQPEMRAHRLTKGAPRRYGYALSISRTSASVRVTRAERVSSRT